MHFEEFRVAVEEEVLDDLRRRLRRTRWLDQIPESGWAYGTDTEYLRELCRYWEAEYDWREAERELNRWPQFVTSVGGQRLHFIHARSPHPHARPLVLTHGWPSTVAEFLRVLDPLTDPVRHGGDAADAFHVIAPSIPGYAWSGPTIEQGWSMGRVAAAFVALLDRLGYQRFGLHGGDWGSLISTEIARMEPSRVSGLHLTMLVTGGLRPEDGEPTDEETALAAAMAAYRATQQGYVAIQSTKPQSLAVGLNDSPAGLAAWIVEKLRAWTDCGGDVESALSRDVILSWLTIYWVTQTAGSAARLYYESARAGQIGPAVEYIGVPTGVAVFPRELFRATRRIAARHYNIERWVELPRGGHFPAAEQPDLLVGELQAFYRGRK